MFAIDVSSTENLRRFPSFILYCYTQLFMMEILREWAIQTNNLLCV